MKRTLAAVLLCLLSVPAWPSVRAAAGTTTRYRYTAPVQAFSRNYEVFVPSDLPQTKVPLIVYLHGCSQTAPDAALGTRWNETAEQLKFIVAYPEQDRNAAGSFSGTSNGSGCWNWFRVDNNQSRGSGEPATIAGITQQVMAKHNIDPRRVYVIGASAGADMAVVLGAAYPDLYAAFGALAGCPYRSCTDSSGVLAFQAMGPRARVMPVFVVQGTADPVNNYALSEALVSEWLGVADLADDGTMNGSISRTPSAVENNGVDASALGGIGQPGNLCLGSNRTPCIGGALGFENYPTTLRRYSGGGHERLIEFWIGHGAGHAYTNGNTQGSFTDPVGPDINSKAYDFFMANPMPGSDPVVDDQPPVITMSVDPGDELDASGWYNASSSGTDGVLVHVTASDPSGVTNITCMDAVGELTLLDTDSASGLFSLYDGSHAVSCQATDGASPPHTGAAENSTPMPLVLDVDQTAPVASGAPSRAPDHAGWYNAPVDVVFTGHDETSGIESCDSSIYEGPDVLGATVDGACTDVAGNSSSPVSSAPFDFDATGPIPMITGVQDGGIYAMGSVPAAGCTTDDNLSGVFTEATVAVSGGSTNGVGAYTASCSGAQDVAGNSGETISAAYVVMYADVRGFLPPVSMEGERQDFAHNRPVLAKFRIGGDEPNGFDTSSWTIERSRFDCQTNEPLGSPQSAPSRTGVATIQYDPEGDQYVYPADFRDVDAPSCWTLRVTLDDGPSPTVVQSPVFRVNDP